ncbi:MAG: hypothetical protein AB1779_08820, partial [Candidatus Thermoplasmatota archaeon]
IYNKRMIQILLLLILFSFVFTLIFFTKLRYYGFVSGIFAVAKNESTMGVTAGFTAGWSVPALVGSAIVIAWGAEAAQFIISQGAALAVLAWLQVMPEFAVEAAIAHSATINPSLIHLVTANFTGANRLLIGVGWPLIFFTSYYFRKKEAKLLKHQILLDEEHSVEVVTLIIPSIYFIYIYIKGSLDIIDSAMLIFIYLVYIWILLRVPPQDINKAIHAHKIPRKIINYKKSVRNTIIILCFIIGGVILLFSAEPFLHSMLVIASLFGLSAFVFVQWVAPFMSEFPEKLSAFYWASTIRFAPMALMNMISSKINHWTVLIAMIPMVFVIFGRIYTISFDEFQKHEILLTMVQSWLGVVCLLKMRFTFIDAVLLFTLWYIQFMFSPDVCSMLGLPDVRTIIIPVYIIFAVILLIIHRKEILVFRAFKNVWKRYISEKGN